MPTYDYACTHCDHAFEVVQSFSDDAMTECPECNGRLRKVFGSVGVVFKGSGFYRNDSRVSSSSSKPASSSGEGSGASNGSSSAPSTSPAGEGGSSSSTKDATSSKVSSSSKASSGSSAA